MAGLSKADEGRLTSAQRRAYKAGKLSADEVRSRGWLGSLRKPSPKKAASKAAEANAED